MHFRRKRCKRQVRCTMCTADRWRGNASGRFKNKETFLRKELDKEMKEML